MRESFARVVKDCVFDTLFVVVVGDKKITTVSDQRLAFKIRDGINAAFESAVEERVREALEELSQCPHGCTDGNCPWDRKLKAVKEKYR